jgi:hypothetical protein
MKAENHHSGCTRSAIKLSVDEQLPQKGLTKVEKDPDFHFGSQAVINLKKGINLSA